MAIGKKRLAARLSQAITGTLETAAETNPGTLPQLKDETCAKALRAFATSQPDTGMQPVPHWQLLMLLP